MLDHQSLPHGTVSAAFGTLFSGVRILLADHYKSTYYVHWGRGIGILRIIIKSRAIELALLD